MSQTTAPEADDESDSIAHHLTTELAFSRDLLDSLESDDLAEMSDEELVEVRTHLKELEDTVESVRKEQADAELEERVEPGEKLLGLHRVQSHNKYVADDVGTVIGRAASRGIDYTEFVSIDASTLADVAPDLAEIGRAEYTYFR